MENKKLAVLTGGGDCPGLNAAIRSVVKAAQKTDIKVYGIEEGFLGLYEDHIHEMTNYEVSGVLPRGGTILRSSRFNPFKDDKVLSKCLDVYNAHKFDGLIVIGGDGSLGIANDLYQKKKFPVIGIPKTIDNDVFGTDRTIGFNTAVQTAMEAIDRLHTTAESHNFIMIVEVMGRHCGYLAAFSGISGGADFILVPEVDVKLSEVVSSIRLRHKRGKNFSILVVSEDANIFDDNGVRLAETKTVVDEYGKIKLGGIGYQVKQLLQKELGFETRYTNLGHVQRGGSPIAVDRLLATWYGSYAVDLAVKGDWGKLVAYVDNQVVAKDISVVREGKKQLPQKFYDLAKLFFG